MPNLFFLSAGPRAVPVFASVAAHAAVAIAAAAGGFGTASARPERLGPVAEIQVEVDNTPPLPAVEPQPAELNGDLVRAGAAAPHTHPYEVDPDHDAHPHAPEIDHRATAPSPPSEARAPQASQAAAALVAKSPKGDEPAPTFSMVIGQASVATGGQASGAGAGDGAGTAVGTGPVAPKAELLHPSVSVSEGGDGTVPEALVSERARLASTLAPEYPSAARNQGVEAVVKLEIVVDPRGNVVDARVVRGAGYGFEQSAVAAIRAARFAPAKRDGAPVRVRMAWTVDFRLE